ncbi:unnamed protein product, partial [Closterium sp. NIES-53]
MDSKEGSVTTVDRRRATVGLAARRESDAGSARTGREDSGGDGNGTRRGAVEGRSVIWCVPGTAGAGPGEGGRPRTCSRSGTKYGLGSAVPPGPTGTAPVPPEAAPVPAAPPAPTAPTPAGPAAPVPLAAPAVPTAGPTPAPTPPAAPAPAAPTPVPTPPVAPAPAALEAQAAPTPAATAAPPVPTAPVPQVRAPPGPGATGGPPAPAARLQRRANHSRSSCGERSSRLDEALREATRADSAPPDSAPLGSAPPGSAPPNAAPPAPAPTGSAPLAAPDGRGSRQCPPPVPGTHRISLRPSTAPLRAPLPSPPESSLPALADPASDSLRAASPTVTRLLGTVVTDPSFESTTASALVAELVDFAARCRLDYAASLVAESASDCPLSVGGDCALGTDVLEDRQEELQCLAAASPHLASVLLAPEGDPDALDIPTPRSYAEAVEGPYSSQWQAAMDAEMASWKSTGTYVDAVPPPGANIVSGMWIFRVKRPPGSPPVFKARYVAHGFSQRQGVDYFQTFSPTPKMTTLRVLLHIAAQRDYELHSLDFITAFLQGSLHEEIWLRRPPGFTGTFPPGTQWSLRRPVYSLRQAPREWHDTLRTTLAALGFAPSTADPSLFLRTDTSLPPFYILVYVDDLVFATADTAGLAYVKSELLKRHTCTDL